MYDVWQPLILFASHVALAMSRPESSLGVSVEDHKLLPIDLVSTSTTPPAESKSEGSFTDRSTEQLQTAYLDAFKESTLDVNELQKWAFINVMLLQGLIPALTTLYFSDLESPTGQLYLVLSKCLTKACVNARFADTDKLVLLNPIVESFAGMLEAYSRSCLQPADGGGNATAIMEQRKVSLMTSEKSLSELLSFLRVHGTASYVPHQSFPFSHSPFLFLIFFNH